jgi:hypothetical protein
LRRILQQVPFSDITPDTERSYPSTNDTQVNTVITHNLIDIIAVTGSTNVEFNFRHDWNSLISNDSKMLMKHYSKEYFPPADTIVKYFEDFASNFNLNIQYNTEIKSILKQNSQFNLMDQNGDTHTCQVLIIR